MPNTNASETKERHPLSFALIQPGEGKSLLLAMAFFFTLLCSYYLLRPLRDAYGSADPDRLRWLFLGTFALTLVVQPAFGALVSRFGRLRIVPVSYRALSVFTIALGLLLGRFEGGTEQLVRDVFFCWLSVYSIVGVSIFWGLLADLYGRERALRLFGFVAVGGTLGAISGASIASFASSLLPRVGLGPEHLPFLSAACLEICVWIQRSLQRASASLEAAEGSDLASLANSAPIGGSVLAGFQRVAQSRYLTLACVYVAIYVVGSTLAYDVAARLAKAAFEADDDARRAFFGKIDLATNIVTLLLQLFASGFVLRKLGVGIGLCAVPIVGVFGFAALALDPTLIVLAVFAVARRAAEYGVSKPARDALFTVVSREDKYKAKLVVDTVIYRGGDAASLWLKFVLIAGGVSASVIAWGLVGLAGAGVLVSLALGRGFRSRAG
ncbi:MAG: AAA family ATP:ADP antiporter [Planctomycetota bacterium]